jgi:transcriptional regulator with XRE-family HTH domain
MNYSKAIRVARSLADLSQGQLADHAQIDRSYLSLIESGKRQPSVETIEKIAVALKLPFHLLSLLGSEETDVQSADAGQIESLALALTKLLLQVSSDESSKPTSDSPSTRPRSHEKPSRSRISPGRRPRSTSAAC